jgi:hypothetical protein
MIDHKFNISHPNNLHYDDFYRQETRNLKKVSTKIIDFVLPVPNNLAAFFYILYPTLVVIKSLQFKNRSLNQTHVFVHVAHLVNLLYFCPQRPYDLVQHHLGCS